MKILLVGEYSGLHNALKEGLSALGHHVTLISTGDYFKHYPTDLSLKRPYSTGILKKIKVALYLLFKIDISSYSVKKQFFSHNELLKAFDVVQLINESPIGIQAKHEIEIISFLKAHNKKLFLLSCGTDFINISYALSDKLKYSVLSSYLNGEVSEKSYKSVLRYLSAPFKKLHQHVYHNIDGVIASDIDYHLPLKDHSKYLGLIAYPINTEKHAFSKLNINDTIVIFHGINRNSFHKKGNQYFEKALSIIQEKYPKKVKIITVENLPYKDYITKQQEAHIVLDQVFSYDHGYNALEAMAKGKVVFTGLEQELIDYYKLKKPIAINAVPDVTKIVAELETLILNPNKIIEIGENARAFVEEQHDHIKIAEQYLEVWELKTNM